MDKLTKLSEAIRYGSTYIPEGQCFGVRHQKYGACAVGTAYLAAGLPEGACGFEEIIERLAERFGVPDNVVAQVSTMHFCKQRTRAECADWLEAQGY